MANANQPDVQQAANGDTLPTEARLHAIERQVAEQSERLAAAGSPERPLNQGNLSDEVARLRDVSSVTTQRSLVDRIGDVDDDLRATTIRFQRARQTQHEETDRRLRRHA